MEISGEYLSKIRELREKQDANAMMVGVATIEWLERVLSALKSVKETRKEQDKVGQEALKNNGIDYQKGNYTIDPANGEILKLQSNASGKAEFVKIKEIEILKES